MRREASRRSEADNAAGSRRDCTLQIGNHPLLVAAMNDGHAFAGGDARLEGEARHGDDGWTMRQSSHMPNATEGALPALILR